MEELDRFRRTTGDPSPQGDARERKLWWSVVIMSLTAVANDVARLGAQMSFTIAHGISYSRHALSEQLQQLSNDLSDLAQYVGSKHEDADAKSERVTPGSLVGRRVKVVRELRNAGGDVAAPGEELVIVDEGESTFTLVTPDFVFRCVDRARVELLPKENESDV